MANSKKVKEAMHKAFEDVRKEIEEMGEEEFKKMLKEHENGDFAIMLRETGAIKIIMEEMKKRRGEKYDDGNRPQDG